MMYEIDTSAPILVTGATGYVAGWIVKHLLEGGVTVHAAVRNPSKSHKYRHLDEIASSTPGNIKYFTADLLDEGSYEQAMEGCSIVFHTASPFVINVEDPQRELVDPAKLGTRNVLTQAGKTPTVKRVVLTSSCAAIYGDNADIENTANGIFSEQDWNTSSSITHNPYSYSKTEAEKHAWTIAEKQSQWELVTINPSLVMGPGLNANATSESFNMITQLGDGSQKSGVPNAGLGVVDVRDVARAHVAAAFISEASGRYLISAHNTTLLELAATLLPKYGNEYPIPRRTLPKWLIWLVAPIVSPGLSRKMVARNFGYAWLGDNSRSIRELGMTYRPLAETTNDFFQQMVDCRRFGNNQAQATESA